MIADETVLVRLVVLIVVVLHCVEVAWAIQSLSDSFVLL